MEYLVEISGMKKIYNKGKDSQCNALNGVDIKIKKGELVAVMGKSGSGKSTLIHMLAGLDTYTEGNYIFEGESLNNKSDSYISDLRNKKIGFIQQDYALINNFTVYENIAVPLYIKRCKKKDIVKRVNEVAELLDISDILHKKIRKLSGGQCQRTAIGRAIVSEPELILADEPTGALDTNNSTNVMKILKELNNHGKTVIISTHDNYLASQCNRIIELCDGIIISDCEKENNRED